MATNVQIKEGEKKKKNIDRSDDYLTLRPRPCCFLPLILKDRCVLSGRILVCTLKIGLSKRRRRGKEILLNCINGHLDAHRWPQRALIIHSSSFRFFCFAFVRPFLCYEEIITILFHGVHFRNSILSISYFSVPNFTSLFIDALIFLHRVLKFFR